jgi:hypothetical protein
MWDQRYRAIEFAYGKDPNDFLVQIAQDIPIGRLQNHFNRSCNF